MNLFKNSLVIIFICLVISVVAFFSLYKPQEVLKPEPKISIKKNSSEPPLESLEITKPTAKTDVTLSKPNQAVSQNKSYKSTVEYDVPDDSESLVVTLTLQNNIVINVETTFSMIGSKSSRYQQDFKNNYKNYVLGKDISKLELPRIAGASLTTSAFNQALQNIRESM